MRSLVLGILLLCLFGLVQSLSSSGSRLLVVTEDAAQDKLKYSKFWKDLEERGYKLSFQSPKSDPYLFTHGQRNYDHLVLLPSKLKALGPALSAQILLDFVKDEGNVLLALSSNVPTPTPITSVLLELDIHLPADRDALVVDHFSYDRSSADEKHDVLLVPPPRPLRNDVKNFLKLDDPSTPLAVPRAVGQTLGNASPLLASVLSATDTAYSYNPKDEADVVEDPFAVGSQLSLITAMQGRNAARFTVIGSAEMLEDTWFDASVLPAGGGKKSKTGNQEFAKKLLEWTFKEVGVLKLGRVQHYEVPPPPRIAPFYFNETKSPTVKDIQLNPKIYRIRNDARFSVELSEYVHDRWIPYRIPPNDALQLEFTMLSPYQRLNLTPSDPTSRKKHDLSPSTDSAVYTTAFRLPDQHGIFSFHLNYKRPFLTPIIHKQHVTVRHFAHDEWPRSYAISGAYVWILGLAVTLVGWVWFVAIWLYSEEVELDHAGRVIRRGVKKTQ
ncbi:MAG: oligosaccharyl transferase glycoprotein complex, beta subunit [Alyxoria varia]|nr:MAG: oligosaccharyl transferase glycoprotein complex, beta subunit [Alyxoria varia]